MKSLRWSLVVFVISMNAGAKEISTGVYALSSQLLPKILAKEICSCLYVSEAAQKFGARDGLKRCISRANLPLSETLLNQLLIISVREKGTITVIPTPLAEGVTGLKVARATATFDSKQPRYGCTLKQ